MALDPFLRPQPSLPHCPSLTCCCWLRLRFGQSLRSWIFLTRVAISHSQCSAPGTIDWAALFISLIAAHPSATLFLHLHCRGGRRAYMHTCVCAQAWECLRGFGTAGGSLTHFPSLLGDRQAHKHLNLGTSHCSTRDLSGKNSLTQQQKSLMGVLAHPLACCVTFRQPVLWASVLHL